MNIFFEKINKYGLPILIAGLPLYLVRFKIFGVPTTLLELMFWFVFLSWFFNNFKSIKERIKNKSKIENRKSKIGIYPFSILIILFVISSFIALTMSGFSITALGIYKAYFIEAILFYVLAFNYFKNRENREKVFWALAISAFVISVFAIYQKVTGNFIVNPFWQNEATRRVTSFFLYPNALGLYLGPITTLLFFLLVKKTKELITNYELRITNKWFNLELLKIIFYLFTFIFSLLSIYFAKSEAALGAILISIFFGSLFISKRFAIGFILLGLISGVVIFTNTNLRTFALEKIQLKDFSGEVRKQQWRETTEMLKNNGAILGVGLSGYQKAVNPYHQEGIFFNESRDPDFRRKIVIFDDKYRAEHWRPVEVYMYPHNIILNFWVELGLLGVIAFFGLVIQFFYFGAKLIQNSKFKIQNSSLKNNKILIIGVMFSMVEILIHGIVDVPYFKNDLSFLFWLIFAMMGVYWVEYKNSNRR
ncbi:MAG: O-antigen ligase family protein [Patescibacteria group bacterium]|jgi:O-antigen ligase|nr:O-antigen ligase family protein [Patescibacteria group bacterium]